MTVNRWIVLSCVLVVCSPVAGAPAAPAGDPGPPEARPDRSAILLKAAEGVAAELEWLDHGFVYDRPPRGGPDPAKAAALYDRLRDPPDDVLQAANRESGAEQSAFAPGPWSADDIRPLLRHADPKVRTLGIVLMYQLNRVDVLPEIADLIDDDGVTFPEAQQGAVALNLGANEAVPQRKWPMREQRVGAFARKVIQAYAEASAELRPMQFEVGGTGPARDRLPALREQLVAFAQKRHPTMCTAALVIAMQRATQGTTPLPHDRQGRAQAVLSLLQQIEMPRRFFVAHRLGVQERGGARYPGNYLLNLARDLPHELRMDAILGRAAIDDRDINDFGYRFFEEHAAELFTFDDADEFLAAPAAENTRWLARPSPRAGLILAAARLRPASAEEILLPAMDAFKEDGSVGSDMRLEIAVELCLLGNDKGIERGIDWFFAFAPQPGSYGGGREGFLGRLARRDPIRARHVTERVIRDDRLTTLGPASTRTLMQAVQGYLGRPLASDADIRDSYGIDEAQRDRKLPSLAEWHAALRSTVDDWAK